MRTVQSCDVDAMRRTLEAAFTTAFDGFEVVIAEGECQLERQRRVKPWIASLLAQRKLADEGGIALDRALAEHGVPARAARAQPIVWMRSPKRDAAQRAVQPR